MPVLQDRRRGSQKGVTRRTPVRIGVLGGAFDPVHYGHLAAAAAARAACGLERVLFLPARQPPHKQCQAGEGHRLAMLRLALADEPGCEVSEFELRRPGPSYTVDTLAGLARAFGPGYEIFFLLGGDAFAEVDSWKEPHRLLDHAHLVVLARSPYLDVDEEPPAFLRRLRRMGQGCWQDPVSGRTVTFVAMTPVACSSTEIRQRLAAGEDVRGLLPAAVARYIVAQRLYGARQGDGGAGA